MVDTDISVKIFNNSSCIYEESSKKLQKNDLTNLIVNLKDIQQKTNVFLTTLVEGKQNESTGEQDQSDASESDSDMNDVEENNEVNPKKSK